MKKIYLYCSVFVMIMDVMGFLFLFERLQMSYGTMALWGMMLAAVSCFLYYQS